ncbi:hypothetical protein LT493_11585 [Streptomyces tricolor]|nr:hypothetical protein [Streptomyces tricolor]
MEEFLRRAVNQGIGGAAIGRRAWAASKPVEAIRGLAAAVHGGTPMSEPVDLLVIGLGYVGLPLAGKPSRPA